MDPSSPASARLLKDQDLRNKAICVVASTLYGIALVPAAMAQDYERFKTFEAEGWTVTDKGSESCDADFAIDGQTMLGIMGPYYPHSGEVASGSIIHLDNQMNYMLPTGDSDGEFPVQLIAGSAQFAASGFAADLGGSLVTDSGSFTSVADLLASFPNEVVLTATVEGKEIFSIELTGTNAAALALKDCTAFITAQKRPGTKNGPELGPPRIVPLEDLNIPSEIPSSAAPTSMPDAHPPAPAPLSWDS